MSLASSFNTIIIIVQTSCVLDFTLFIYMQWEGVEPGMWTMFVTQSRLNDNGMSHANLIKNFNQLLIIIINLSLIWHIF